MFIKSHRDFQPGSGSSFAQQHHWHEQKPPLAGAFPGSLVGCIQPGTTQKPALLSINIMARFCYPAVFPGA